MNTYYVLALGAVGITGICLALAPSARARMQRRLRRRTR